MDSPRDRSPRRDSPDRPKPHRIFIGNLPTGNDAPSQADIERLYEEYGNLREVTIKPGYAFVV